MGVDHALSSVYLSYKRGLLKRVMLITVLYVYVDFVLGHVRIIKVLLDRGANVDVAADVS